MKNTIVISLLFIALFFAFRGTRNSVAAGDLLEGQSFVGVADCAKCHRKASEGAQFKIWRKSKHAGALEALKSEKAVQIGKERGLAKAPHESAECLKCHVSGNNVDAALLGPKFSMEEGVQCETCHGAGSLYKDKDIMKSREESIANGMKPLSVKDGSAEKHCRGCHNEESPTYKEFIFAERWKEIEHPMPAE